MNLKKEFELDAKHIFTVPNILSYIRIILIAPFIVFFLYEKYIAAAICLILSGLSDCVDGFLARKLNQITRLGKVLDPIADKLTLLAVGVCICIKEPLVIPAIIVMIIKDGLMLSGATYMVNKGVIPFASEWYGKVGTLCFYTSVTAIVVFELVVKVPNFWIASVIMLSVTTFIMLYSLFRYSQIFRRMMAEAKENNKTQTEE